MLTPVRHLSTAGLLLGASLTCAGDSTGSHPPPGSVDVHLEQVATGFKMPVLVLSAPGDTGRLFVVEKGGTVRVLKHGVLLPTPFIDLGSRVTGGSEQGLLGMAFHPRDGRVVLSFTIPGPTGGGRSRIATFTTGADPDVLDPASEQAVIEFDQPYSNHNGGHVVFGPDGYLYAGFGDGGSGGDPQGHGQDRNDLLGSLLRLDLDHGLPYTIPATNPFVGQPNMRGELWNWGLRNPWRFSFDRGNGNLYIADVGQNAWEEVDVQPAASTGGENSAGTSWRGTTATWVRAATRRGSCFRRRSMATTTAARSRAGSSTAARPFRNWRAPTSTAITAADGSGASSTRQGTPPTPGTGPR